MKKNDNSLLFTVIVFFIVIGVIGVALETDIIADVSRLAGNTLPDQKSAKSSHGETYYQWYERGEMKITSKPPPVGIKFLTFSGGPGIQRTNYNVDPDLIARANAYRRQLLVEDKSNYEDEAESLIASLISSETQAVLKPDKHCNNLSNWLSDLTSTIQYDKSANKEFCQLFEKRISSISKMGCTQELKSFHAKICSF